MKRKELGNIGEKLARDFLKKKGYRIHETNFRCRAGEIDIIAQKKDCLAFIEVTTCIATKEKELAMMGIIEGHMCWLRVVSTL